MEFVSTDCRSGKALTPELVDVVIYHAKCTDGFAAAYVVWAAREKGRGIQFVPREHTAQDKAAADIMPLLQGKHVLIVDYCFPLAVMQAMIATAASLLVLDHHESAQGNMTALPGANKVFEMRQSGATLAHNFMHGHLINVPLFLRFVEDYDIWRKALPNVEAFSVGVRALPLDFEAWHAAFSSNRTEDLQRFIDASVAQVKWRDERVRIAAAAAKQCKIRGFESARALAVNETSWINEVADRLLASDSADVVVVWRAQIAKDGVKCIASLRSRKAELGAASVHINVADIASTFGGGGHATAAGFDCFVPFRSDVEPPFQSI
jgi:oligoribonuclease NrnB/cAMP/cGMP phosphodiesterase (DHH superfamily)